MNVKPLLDFIAKPESGGDYNIVYGGIAKKNRLKQPLITMTIAEVLAWQDSIDAMYPSEAAGRYQIMEDTLRGLWPEAGMTLLSLFNEAGQDKLATTLLRRRGLVAYMEGKISAEEFANRLAMEWASLPVVTGPKKGSSYYSGDGLNKSHVSVEAFLAAVRAIKDAPNPVADSKPADPVGKSPWAALLASIINLFRKNSA